MQAAILTIGDEILIGQVVDTNSAWLGRELSEVGIQVAEIRSVQDTPEAIEWGVRELMERYPLVISTGGLGPTRDDRTKATLASLFGMELAFHAPTAAHVEQMLTKRGVAFNALNQSQAMLPDGCVVLSNPIGTAPGMWFEGEGSLLVSLPGVPFEMKRLVQEELLPRLATRYTLSHHIHRTALSFGLAESILAERLTHWEDALPKLLHLAYLPSPMGVRLRLSAYDTDPVEASKAMNTAFASLEQELGEHLVGYGDTSLEEAVAQRLIEQGATLAVAESCTGGNIAHRLTLQSGASAYLLGGVVSYANAVKEQTLGVPSSLLETHGAVSEEVAQAMAEGVRRLMGTTYGLATTGIAGPDGGSDQKPVGTVWLALATPAGTITLQRRFGTQRAANIEHFSSAALDLLRRNL